MSGHHLIVSDEGAPRVRCDEPANASCRAFYDCGCESYYDAGVTEDGHPYHLPQPGHGDIHVGDYRPKWCVIEEWFSEVPDGLLHGEYAIPLRVEWDHCPILHLPEPTEETP